MTFYISHRQLSTFPFSWRRVIDTLHDAVLCLHQGRYAQPIKPYLRYQNPANRIIAMPAYAGAPFEMAGIKWIASFPDNLEKGLPRAHSVVILNEASSGRPLAIINSPLLSVIRTAGVSGLMIRQFLALRPSGKIRLGIIGWGPIGKAHFEMCRELLGTHLDCTRVFDLKGVDAGTLPVIESASWPDVYLNSDIFITCTVSKAPYIDLPPNPGSLHLNVSLRDYKTDVMPYFEHGIVVDDWEEVCREKTDIEMMHLERGLRKDQTISLPEVVAGNALSALAPEMPVMFNPMGMAVFDIAVGASFFKAMEREQCGTVLD